MTISQKNNKVFGAYDKKTHVGAQRMRVIHTPLHLLQPRVNVPWTSTFVLFHAIYIILYGCTSVDLRFILRPYTLYADAQKPRASEIAIANSTKNEIFGRKNLVHT